MKGGGEEKEEEVSVRDTRRARERSGRGLRRQLERARGAAEGDEAAAASHAAAVTVQC